MTDTTDLKALREECAQWVKEAIGEAVDTRMALNGDGNDYMSWDMSVIWLAWLHLSGKLEAERQRADELKSFYDQEQKLAGRFLRERDCARQVVDELQAEIAALKPEINWPVAQKVRAALDRAACPDAFMRIAVEACTVALKGEQVPLDTGIFTRDELAVACKARVRDMPENYADHQIAKVALNSLSTAPQKPVISKEKLCDWLEDNFDIDDSQRAAFAACFSHCCDCIVQSDLSEPVGEIVAWAGTDREKGITREVDFRFLRFDVLPGTKLYAVTPKPAAKSDLLTRAQALAVETRALACRIKAGD